MKHHPTLPPFGEIVPGEGGRLGGIMRGALIDGVRQPDYALIVPDLPAVRLKWGKDIEIKGANSLTDGLANTRAMLEAQCPPALHIASLKTAEGHTDLYLPARGEMWALRANVPELFEKDWHWTSTQDGRSSAFVQDFELGYSGWFSKDYDFFVRAARRIPLYHINA